VGVGGQRDVSPKERIQRLPDSYRLAVQGDELDLSDDEIVVIVVDVEASAISGGDAARIHLLAEEGGDW